MCETMMHEGHNIMIYPTLSPVREKNKHETVDGKTDRSLEECCEVIQLIAVKLEILLHARDVGIVLDV